MSNEEIGRLPPEQVGEDITLDNPTKVVEAVNSKIDELIDAVQAWETSFAHGGDGSLVVALKKLVFKL